MYIMKNQRGLLVENGEYTKLLMPGKYFLWPHQTVELFSMGDALQPKNQPLSLILQTVPGLADQLIVLDVLESNIALYFRNGIFTWVLKPGKFAFWKGLYEHTFVNVSLENPQIDPQIDRLLFNKPEIREYLVSYSIEPYEKGLLFIDKTSEGVLEPGNYFYWKGAQSINVFKVDLRQQQIEVNGQEILSRDKIPLRLNFICQYKISDVQKAGMEIKELEAQFHVILQLAIREYVGSLSLDEILEKKAEIGSFVTEKIRNQTQPLGVDVLFSGVKDIILPGEIKDILNQVLIAEKKSQANVIMRREETASTRSLLNTAKLMEENALLYKLKELEYVERISEKISQISVSGGAQIIDQLKEIFLPGDKRGT